MKLHVFNKELKKLCLKFDDIFGQTPKSKATKFAYIQENVPKLYYDSTTSEFYKDWLSWIYGTFASEYKDGAIDNVILLRYNQKFEELKKINNQYAKKYPITSTYALIQKIIKDNKDKEVVKCAI